MKTSTEKVWELLEELQDSEDNEIKEAFNLNGFPPTVLRLLLTAVTEQIPQDPAELDDFLTKVGQFCLSLRTDRDAQTA